MTLTVEEYKAYLKFDQLTLNQFSSLLEGHPFHRFLGTMNENKKNIISAMAIASIREGKIKPK